MYSSILSTGLAAVALFTGYAEADTVKPGCDGVLSEIDPLYPLIDECWVRQCDTSLQSNGTNGEDVIGAAFTKCLIPSDDDFADARFSGCDDSSRCFWKNEWYAQCVPEDRVLDGSKPRFVADDGASLIEIICGVEEPDSPEEVAAGPSSHVSDDECLLFGDMCEQGIDECCGDLGCYPADTDGEEFFCLECPGGFPVTYERCGGGDLVGTSAEGNCCFSTDECVMRDNSYGSCRPVEESCCDRITFELGERSYRCPRRRDPEFVAGPCDVSSTQYMEELDNILEFILNNTASS